MSNLIAKHKELAVAATRDIQAFSELYEYYFPLIYNYIYARIGEGDKTDDLTSQVFEKIVTKINSYNPAYGAFSTWIFKIAQNTIIDYYRKNNRITVVYTEGYTDISFDDDPLDEMIILREEKKNLLDCLSKLSDRERNIIALKFWAQLSNLEISEVVKESSNHVAVILYRAIKKLKHLMLEKEAG